MIEESFHGVVVLTKWCWSVDWSVGIYKERDIISYAHKEYGFVVQQMAMEISWAACGYPKDRAP